MALIPVVGVMDDTPVIPFRRMLISEIAADTGQHRHTVRANLARLFPPGHPVLSARKGHKYLRPVEVRQYYLHFGFA